jgi:hypothetical protein
MTNIFVALRAVTVAVMLASPLAQIHAQDVPAPEALFHDSNA